MNNIYKTCILLSGLSLLSLSAAGAQSPDTTGGRLKFFEKTLSAKDTTDTATVSHHRDEDDSGLEEDGSIWGELLFFLPREIFKLCAAAYCSLPGPNYGPYPYSSVSVFTAQHEKEPGNYLILGSYYSHVYKDIPSGQVEASFYIHSLVLATSYQQFRENGDRLHLTAIRIGSRKALGDYVLWQNHFGWRYMKGTSGMSGYLLGTQFKFFNWNRIAYILGYDFDFFPEYGTAFHEVDAGLSYYVRRLEFKAGYQAKMIYEGPSLHGPYAGICWNF